MRVNQHLDLTRPILWSILSGGDISNLGDGTATSGDQRDGLFSPNRERGTAGHIDKLNQDLPGIDHPGVENRRGDADAVTTARHGRRKTDVTRMDHQIGCRRRRNRQRGNIFVVDFV